MFGSFASRSTCFRLAAALIALGCACASAWGQSRRAVDRLPGEMIDVPEPVLDPTLKPLDYNWRHEPHHQPSMPGPIAQFGKRVVEWPLMMMSYLGDELGDHGRHKGRGDPLVGTSWMNRPLYFSLFTGGTFGDSLIDQRVEQRGGMLYGMRLGTDLDYYWGVEARGAYTEPDLSYTTAPTIAGSSQDYFLDVNVLYYPWGDSRWRPYASIGMGLARFEFRDENARLVDDALFHLPLGIGLKHYFRNWISLRVDFQDNIAFGSRELATMNNYSLTGGAEFHFGGRRRSYWPYNPGIHPR